MELYGLSREDIKLFGVLSGDYYVLEVGTKVDVTVIRKNNSNGILSSNLSIRKLEDKFMMKYIPNNILYFDKEFVESKIHSNLVSCKIDNKSCCVFIGNPDKYDISSGVLATTGVLSLNGLVQRNRSIYYSQLKRNDVKKKITILSVGLRGDNLFGLYHIPRIRGLALSVDDSESMGMSLMSLRVRDCWRWGTLNVTDWFDKCKIVQL